MKILKLTLPLLLISGLLFISSCDKVAELFQVNLNVTDTIEFVVPQAQLTSINIDTIQEIQFNVDSFIRENTDDRATLTDLKSVKLNAASLFLPETANPNFDIFENVAVSFYTNNYQIPYGVVVNSIPSPSYAINLPIDSNRELRPYFDGNLFYYKLIAKVKNDVVNIYQDIPCKLVVSYTLTVQK
jgi:hypothetical protein